MIHMDNQQYNRVPSGPLTAKTTFRFHEMLVVGKTSIFIVTNGSGHKYKIDTISSRVTPSEQQLTSIDAERTSLLT
jgi:hypothetical protein